MMWCDYRACVVVVRAVVQTVVPRLLTTATRFRYQRCRSLVFWRAMRVHRIDSLKRDCNHLKNHIYLLNLPVFFQIRNLKYFEHRKSFVLLKIFILPPLGFFLSWSREDSHPLPPSCYAPGYQAYPCAIARCVRRIAKSYYKLHHVSLSVHPPALVEQLGSHWTDFREI